VHVDWGDGSADDVSAAGPFLHTYTTLGRYTITVSGSLTGFGQDPLTSGDPLLGASFLKSVRSFGELGITSLNLAFYGSANLIDVPSTLPATVIDVRGMFVGASSFNGDVSGWDTGQMTSMRAMFAGASSFNQSLNSWDTGSVTNMFAMFYLASSFNQSLDSWDTGSVTNMNGMFYFASSFNQSLGAWDISEVVSMNNMLTSSALSVDNYDATLIGWADIQQAKQQNVVLGADGLFFSSNGASAHDTLTNHCVPNPSNWQINDAGLDPNSLINNDQFFAVGC
jgi:surface protein